MVGKVRKFVEAIYNAAFDETGWQDIATGLTTSFGGKSSIIQLRDVTGNTAKVLGQHEMATARVADYEQHYYKLDMWADAVMSSPGRVLDMDDLVSSRMLLDSEFYADCLRPNKMRFAIGGVFSVDKTRVGMIGLHRQEGDPVFDSAIVRQFNEILPHLRQGMLLRLKLGDLAARHDLISSILDRIGRACIAVDREVRLVFANASASALLDASPVLRIGPLGQLQCGRGEEQRALTALVNRVTKQSRGVPEAAGGSLLLHGADEAPEIAVTVTPLLTERSDIGQGRPLALIFLSGVDAAPADKAFLQQVFGLTPREAELAALLSAGQSLAAAAHALGIALWTARTHMRSIFDKTGTHRQAELVALLMSYPR